jgi:Methyltransferase domain
MDTGMDLCRNCGSQEIRELGFVGQVAPFFLKRVFNIEIRSGVSKSAMKQALRSAASPTKKYWSRLYGGDSAYIEMQICKTCSFVQAKHPFSDDAIARLYLDYRSDTYNRERIQYEPSYRVIAERVGTDDIEVETRVNRVTRWLSDKIELNRDFTMLDYGGADGRFLPNVPGKKYVYELSNIEPLPGITRIPEKSRLDSYSYVHVAHVLEHVVNPLELVRQVSQYVRKNGYLYLEVPQDTPDAELKSLQEGAAPMDLPVHEHINRYSTQALARLVTAAGLRLIATQADEVDLGWIRCVQLRALGKRD